MAIFTCTIKRISRGQGMSIVAEIAKYRACKLTDNRKIKKLQEEIDLLEKERESILRDKEALAFEGVDCTVKQTLPELEKQVR